MINALGLPAGMLVLFLVINELTSVAKPVALAVRSAATALPIVVPVGVPNNAFIILL